MVASAVHLVNGKANNSRHSKYTAGKASKAIIAENTLNAVNEEPKICVHNLPIK